MRVGLTLGGVLLALLVGCAPNATPNAIAAAPGPQSPARDQAYAAFLAAVARHDIAQAITIETAWAKDHPTDLEFRRREPFLHLMAGDQAGWERSRTDLLATWPRVRGATPPLSPPSFVVDIFKTGGETIIAEQCYERGGKFGVLYRFTVLDANNRGSSFFTVESPDSDNQIARETGRPSPVFTLDHFRPGLHETVTFLPGPPSYADLRQRVLAYMVHPNRISASTGQPGLSTENCGLALHPTL